MPTAQEPINSGFGAASTTSDVIAGIDLQGKTAIVTGGYAGLGLETVRTLIQAGATVIVPARDVRKARAAVPDNNRIEVAEMDLLDPESVDRFSAQFLSSGRELNILVNSAGVMAIPQLTLDPRGIEQHFATNHLGHFQLTTALLPALRSAKSARVVCVSAWAHRLSELIFEDPNFSDREYKPMLGYAQSKTANILFAVGLDDREKGNGIRAFALHPGSILTDLGRNFSEQQRRAFGLYDADGNRIIDPSRQLKTVEQGAATQVWCATHPSLRGIGGVYCENVDVARVVPPNERSGWASDDSTRKVGVMPHAIDPSAARRLWDLSEQMLGSWYRS